MRTTLPDGISWGVWLRRRAAGGHRPI